MTFGCEKKVPPEIESAVSTEASDVATDAREMADQPVKSTALASSSRSDFESPDAVLDGKLKTAWVGTDGPDRDEWIALTVPGDAMLEGIVMFPGHVKDAATFVGHSVPYVVDVSTDNGPVGSFTLQYDEECDEWPPDSPRKFPGCAHSGTERNRTSPRVIWFSEPVVAERVRLTLSGRSEGLKHEALAIAEVDPLVEGESSPWIPEGVRDLLRAMRDKRDPNLDASAEIDDLRDRYVKFGAGEGESIVETMEPKAVHPLEDFRRRERIDWPYFARVAPDERANGDSFHARFLAYLPTRLEGSPIRGSWTVFSSGDNVVLAGIPLTWGNEVGGELYPVLVLDPKGRLVRATEVREHGRRDWRPTRTIPTLK